MTDPVTAQPTRDQLRALADKATPGPWEWHHQEHKGTIHPTFLEGRTEDDWVLSLDDAFTPSRATLDFIAAARTALPQLLDQLDAAERRIRDLTQEVRDERGAALDQMEQVRIRDARIQAVEDVLGEPDAMIGTRLHVTVDRIRRALESVPPPGQ